MYIHCRFDHLIIIFIPFIVYICLFDLFLHFLLDADKYMATTNQSTSKVAESHRLYLQFYFFFELLLSLRSFSATFISLYYFDCIQFVVMIFDDGRNKTKKKFNNISTTTTSPLSINTTTKYIHCKCNKINPPPLPAVTSTSKKIIENQLTAWNKKLMKASNK